MNCLEFRRRLGTEPDCHDDAFAAHRATCESCAAAAARAAEFERELRRAVALPVPEGLSARIAVRQSFTPRRSAATWRSGMALAASLVLAFGVGLVLPSLLEKHSLAEGVEHHVLANPHPPTPGSRIGERTVEVMLEALNMQIDGIAGDVRAASICAVGDLAVAHFVLQGEKGPLDVVVIPGQRPDARQTLSGPGRSGVMVPVEGGALALMGQPGEPLDGIEKALSRAIRSRL